MKKTLITICCIAICLMLVLTGCTPLDHIEDTNGADDYSLQQITEDNVVSLNMGTRGSISESQLSFNFGDFALSDGVKYSSSKFTGVYLLYTTTLFRGSDIHVMLGNFKINGGNFAFYVVFDGKIVGQVTPSGEGLSEFILENVDKTASLEYIIAGESASFEFVIPGGLL